MATVVQAAVGTGTDIVSVGRVARLIETAGDRFLRRWFTASEIGYCTGTARPALHFAARLAAKEAVVKSLGAPGEGPLPWRSIEIDRSEGGVPTVRLSGRVSEVATSRGIAVIHVSLSHCDEFAVAVAVAVAAHPGS